MKICIHYVCVCKRLQLSAGQSSEVLMTPPHGCVCLHSGSQLGGGLGH